MQLLARAPGRVNLLGDHTDTTGGLVLPMAIDRFTELHGTRLPGWVRLRSEDVPGEVRFPLHDPGVAHTGPPWGRYVAAVAAELAPFGPLDGFDAVVRSTVPVGAGLSSSAALEVAVALALWPHGHRDPVALADVCRRAEHRASGVPCGIMDQFIGLMGRQDCAVMIDCTTLEHQAVALPADVEVVVRFVAQRTLAASQYAERTASLAAVETLIGPLRLATLDQVEALDDAVLRRRARHVVTENARVRSGVQALVAGDIAAFGAAMTASHASLRDDFEVSTPAMDAAVQSWLDRPGVFGARLTGGGFGGCIVAVARPGALGHERDTWVVRAVDGAAGSPG